MKKRFQHRYTLPAIVTLLIVTIAAIVFGIYQYSETTTYPDNSSARVMGILLDQNRGHVDFKQLERADVSFVYLRSTQGRSYFDDRYLENRDRLQGTNLDFGTVQFFSDESTINEQLAYFQKKVGSNSGNLPILIAPAVANESKSYWQSLNQFALNLINKGKRVMVLVKNRREASYLSKPDVLLMSRVNNYNTKNPQFVFTQYTNTGRIGQVSGMDNLTMYSFIGSQSKYNQFMGR